MILPYYFPLCLLWWGKKRPLKIWERGKSCCSLWWESMKNPKYHYHARHSTKDGKSHLCWFFLQVSRLWLNSSVVSYSFLVGGRVGRAAYHGRWLCQRHWALREGPLEHLISGRCCRKREYGGCTVKRNQSLDWNQRCNFSLIPLSLIKLWTLPKP